jgi:hypothetical protein
LYISLNIIKKIKSRRMGWARHVAHIEEKLFAYEITGTETLSKIIISKI